MVTHITFLRAKRPETRCRSITVLCMTMVLAIAAQCQNVEVSTGGPVTNYTTLRDAFNAINAGTHTGNILIEIANNTTETAPCVLNSSGAGSASYSAILIRPRIDGLAITGPIATGRGVIELNGADNVTIDGDNPYTPGTNRNLTIRNSATNTVTYTSVVRLATSAAVSTTNGCRIRNCLITGNATGRNTAAATSLTASENTTFGIYSGGNGGSTVITAPTAINNVTTIAAQVGTTIDDLRIENNQIISCARAIVINGAAATVHGGGLTITNNLIGSQTLLTTNPPFTTPTSTVYVKGIYVAGATHVNISGNIIRNIISYVSTLATGIELISSIGPGTITISGNEVNTVVANAGTGTQRGIDVNAAAGGASVIVSNNTVHSIQSAAVAGSDPKPTGIRIAAPASGSMIERNSISRVYNRATGTGGVFGIDILSGDNLILRNNCVSDINQNIAGGVAFDGVYGTFGIKVAGGTGQAVLHNTVNLSGPVLVGSNSEILSAAIMILNTSSAFQVRNNVFANTLAGGTTSVAHVCMWLPDGGGPFIGAVINNNAYYTGTTVGVHGVAHVGTPYTATPVAPPNFRGLYRAADFDPSSISPTTNFRRYTYQLSAAGTNDNASFAASTAVPLASACSVDNSTLSAMPLNGTGASGTGVTVDLAGEARSSPPDIGADEFPFTPCSGTPVAGSIAGPANGCSGQLATLTLAGATEAPGIVYLWAVSTDGGDSYTDLGASATQPTGALDVGTYHYRCTVSCALGSSSVTEPYVHTVEPTPVSNAAYAGSVCAGGTLQLQGSSDIGTSYAWSGPQGYSSTEQNPALSAVTVLHSGEFQVTASTAQCTGLPGPVIVVVKENPVVTSTNATPSALCSGTSTTLQVVTPPAGMVFSRNTGAGLATLTDPVTSIGALAGDTPSSVQDIGFTFRFHGTDHTQFSVSPDGWLLLGGTTPAAQATNNVTSTTNVPKLYPYWDDLTTGASGHVRHQVFGSAPDRVLVVQWFVAIPLVVIPALSTTNSIFQCWLYEHDGRVEYRYGAMGSATMSASIGYTVDASTFQSITLVGSGAHTVSSTTANNSVSLRPTSGTYFRFEADAVPSSVAWTPTSLLVDPGSAITATVALEEPQQFSVEVARENGCTATRTVAVEVAGPMSEASIGGGLVLCGGGGTTLTALAADGGDPYTYLWSPGGEISQSIEVSEAGIYSCQVTSACGGSANTGDVVVAGAPVPGGSVNGPTVGNTYQQLEYTVVGYSGSPGFQWQQATAIDGPYTDIGVDSDALNVQFNTAGTYHLRCVITDPISNCVSVAAVSTVVTVAGDDVCDAIPIQVGTNGPFSNQGATVQAGEPQPPRVACTSQVSWCTGSSGIPNNSVWFSFVAPASGLVSLNFGTTANWDSQIALWRAQDCNGLLSGSAMLVAANDDITGSPWPAALLSVCVTPGETYFVQVDGNANTTNSAFEIVLVEEPNALTAALAAGTTPVCEGASSSVTFIGTPGAVVSYSVNGGDPLSGVMAGGSLVVATEALGASATYELLSVSQGACSRAFSGQTATIAVREPRTTASVTGGGTVCEGAPLPAVVFSFTGTEPYSFTFSDGLYIYPVSGVSGTVTIDQPEAGTFSIVSMNDAHCATVDLGGSVSVVIEPRPTVSATVTDASCPDQADGALDVDVSGGSGPYTYAWTSSLPCGDCPVDLPSCLASFCSGSSEDLSAVPPGPYTVTVTAANGCPSAPTPFTVASISPDTDGDGTADCLDGCPGDPGKIAPGQCGCDTPETDDDLDGTANCLDDCPLDPNKIAPGTCGCGVPDTDTDGDLTADCNDGCPLDPNKVAPGACGCGVADLDSDNDGTPDCNDGCPADPDKVALGICGCGVPDTDGDGDGIADCNDGCPDDPLKNAPGVCGCGIQDVPVDYFADTDGDGFGAGPAIPGFTCAPPPNTVTNNTDGCPDDPFKQAAGACGCGIADTDSDGDNTPDCIDGCPNDPLKIALGQCGCGIVDTDSDGDGIADCNDGCPNDPLKTSAGQCGCGTADTDSDNDGTADCNDACPDDPLKVLEGACGCGTPDVPQTYYADTDGDGFGSGPAIPGFTCAPPLNTVTNNTDGCPNDALKQAPGICGCGASDADSDNDGIANCNDGCPNDPLKTSAGQCGCGNMDTDSDGDGTADCIDACPADPNKIAFGQCGCGVADTDTDGDGTADCNDDCPNDPNKVVPGNCGCGFTEGACLDCAGVPNGLNVLDACGVCLLPSDPNFSTAIHTLSFAGTTNFESALIFPQVGAPSVTYVVEVVYTNSENGQLPNGWPRVILDFEGNGVFTNPQDRIVLMSAVDPADVTTTDGKLYRATILGLAVGTNWQTRVISQSGSCVAQIGPFNYPDVITAPDLEIFANDISFSNSNPDVSSPLTVSATVHNNASQSATNVLVRLVNQFDPGAIYPDVTISSIAANSASTVSWNITTPSVPAWCPMQVFVDADDAIAESNELNNSAIRPFTNGSFVLPGTITVTANPNPANAYQGSTATVAIQGTAVYTGTGLVLPDYSVAGGSVTVSVAGGGSYTGLTNSAGQFSVPVPAIGPMGTTTVTVQVTDFTLTGSTSTSYMQNPAQSCLPDLKAQIFLSSSVLAQGQSVSGTVEVINMGCAAVAVPTALVFTSSSGAAIAPISVPTLAPGATFSAPFTSEAVASIGAYSICVTADGTFLVAEASENNTDCVGFSVLPLAPDLVASSMSLGASLLCNATSPTLTVSNAGALAAGTFDVRVRVLLGASVQQTFILPVASLGATSSVTLPIPFTYTVPGAYSFEVECDIPLPNGNVAEYNEDNNTRTFSIVITPCLPDLQVTACTGLSVPEQDPAFPGTIIYSAQVRNVGTAAAIGPIDVSFSVSGGDVHSTQIPGNMLPGTTATVTVNVPSVAAGATLTVQVDPDNMLAETNESNNSASGALCLDLEPKPICGTGANFWEGSHLLNSTSPVRIGLASLGLYRTSAVTVRFEVSGPGIVGTAFLGDVVVPNVNPPADARYWWTLVFPSSMTTWVPTCSQ
jgi:subtilase family serine protease